LLGERLGRIQNTHLTTGDGAAKPKGIVTAATLGRTTASATAITADDFIRLIHSVDPAYRGSPGVAFMMHDNIFLEVSLLKDSNNNYLVRPTVDAAFTGATPYRIRGFNVATNQAMASSLASANKTALFGDFSKYMIREVGNMELIRLVERFAEYFQEGFIASLSFDGNLLDAGTNPVKYLQQAA
jgi:HK97 family phage major capsid protein